MKQLIHCLRFCLRSEEPSTQTTHSEQEAIKRYASGAHCAVEIGVFEGVNTAHLTRAIAQDGKLYAIDPFFRGRIGMSYEKIIAHLHVKRNGNSGQINWIRKLSFHASHDVPLSVDFMFIDGDHSLEGISRDWELFSPKIRKGGHLLLHDSFELKKGKRMGSHEFFEEVISVDDRFDFIERIDSLAVMRRK